MGSSVSELFGVLLFLVLFVANGALLADDRLNALMNEGKFGKAVEYIEQSIPSQQRTVEIWLMYADAIDKSGGEKQKALAAFTEAQKVQPSDPRIFAVLGDFYSRQKNYQDAMKP
jgi:tetratricopeptide (TPR) repeat protein